MVVRRFLWSLAHPRESTAPGRPRLCRVPDIHGPGSHARMPPSEDGPPETWERRCPACDSEAITPANHFLAIDDRLIKVIKEEFRCAACGTAFWIVR
jgi:hypothetical protein